MQKLPPSEWRLLPKEAEYPRLRNGKYAGPNPRIPRRVRGHYAAYPRVSAAGAGACVYAAADSADMPRNGNSVYATRGYSASLAVGDARQGVQVQVLHFGKYCPNVFCQYCRAVYRDSL